MVTRQHCRVQDKYKPDNLEACKHTTTRELPGRGRKLSLAQSGPLYTQGFHNTNPTHSLKAHRRLVTLRESIPLNASKHLAPWHWAGPS